MEGIEDALLRVVRLNDFMKVNLLASLQFSPIKVLEQDSELQQQLKHNYVICVARTPN